MAESFNGLYKWELIYRQGPWCGLDNVEFATMTYVDWFDHRRLHDRLSCMWSHVSTRERAGNAPSSTVVVIRADPRSSTERNHSCER